MMRYRQPGRRGEGNEDAASRTRVGDRLRELLKLPDSAIVSFVEQGCSQCDCGEGESAVIVFHPNQKVALVRIAQRLADMSDDDIRHIARKLSDPAALSAGAAAKALT